MCDRARVVLGLVLVIVAAPRPAAAHSGPCSASDSFTTVVVATVLGLLLFRPWRRSTMSVAGRVSRWVFPALLASAVTVGACAPKTAPSANRPFSAARVEFVEPSPGETVGPDLTVSLNLTNARVVGPTVTGGSLRGDEGHIHLTLDGKLVSMAYGTSDELRGLDPGPHTLQAEFVATDHAPFSNRVIAAVAFEVAAEAPGHGP